MSTIRQLLFAGLSTDFTESNKPLKIEDLAPYINLGSLTELSTALTGLISISTPEPNSKNAKIPPKK